MALSLCAALAWAIAATPAAAQATDWTGAEDTDWTNANNWTEGVPDGRDASVNFGAPVLDAQSADTGTLYIADSRGSQGTLTITNGGALGSSYVIMGFREGARGTVTVTGDGSTWTTESLDMAFGFNARGTLTIKDGGHVTSTGGQLGYQQYSQGTATVTGAGSRWTITTGNLDVGLAQGSGTLTIAEGGTVDLNSGVVSLADTGGGWAALLRAARSTSARAAGKRPSLRVR